MILIQNKYSEPHTQYPKRKITPKDAHILYVNNSNMIYHNPSLNRMDCFTKRCQGSPMSIWYIEMYNDHLLIEHGKRDSRINLLYHRPSLTDNPVLRTSPTITDMSNEYIKLVNEKLSDGYVYKESIFSDDTIECGKQYAMIRQSHKRRLSQMLKTNTNDPSKQSLTKNRTSVKHITPSYQTDGHISDDEGDEFDYEFDELTHTTDIHNNTDVNDDEIFENADNSTIQSILSNPTDLDISAADLFDESDGNDSDEYLD